MKKIFALSTALVAGLFVACDDSSSASDDESSSSVKAESSSSAKDESSSSVAADDCVLEEEGVKILLPTEGAELKIGDTVTVKFVANYANAGGFRVLYKNNADDKGTDLFETSIGDEAPDGKSCTTEKAVLKSDLVSASDEAILRVQTYNVPKIRGDVNIVVKE